MSRNDCREWQTNPADADSAIHAAHASNPTIRTHSMRTMRHIARCDIERRFSGDSGSTRIVAVAQDFPL
jgi:hypothetical protein